MLAYERLDRMRLALQRDGRVVISELARDLDVSEMTIRRDLRSLEEEGLAARVHGGAVAAGGLRWRARLDRHQAAKRTAADKLARLLPGRGSIYLDGSTTVYHLAAHLQQASGLTVTTNNIDTLQLLQGFPGVQALLLGGRLHPVTDNLVGALARRGLQELSFDCAFFSAYGIDAELGLCEPELEDAEIKDLVQARARRIGVALNHQKFGQRAAGTWRITAAASTLATDLPPTDERLQPFAAMFTSII